MKTLAEVYKNASDEVREILKSKFDNSELGIEYDEIEIKNEILSLIKKNIKNIRFLDEDGNHIDLPTNRFEICDENGKWLFDINYDEKNTHFWYSHYKVFLFFYSKYRINDLKFNEILKGILEEELNLMGVTPSIQADNETLTLEEELNLMGVTPILDLFLPLFKLEEELNLMGVTPRFL